MILPVTMYSVQCDGCGVAAEEGTDYFAWSDPSEAAEQAAWGDWRVEGGNPPVPELHTSGQGRRGRTGRMSEQESSEPIDLLAALRASIEASRAGIEREIREKIAAERRLTAGERYATELLAEVNRLRDQIGAVLQLCDEPTDEIRCDCARSWHGFHLHDVVRCADVKEILG